MDRSDEHLDWDELENIYFEAMSLPEAKQESFLMEKCRGNLALRDKISKMLSVAGKNERLVAEDLLGRADFENPIKNFIGRMAGPYRLEKLIGEGGMGQVYLGIREHADYNQTVAVKLVRPELASPDSMTRFRRERQILAQLNHPNIAHLLGGEVTEWGSPYLAMEYVEGDDIFSYCDKNKLDLNERLVLFQKVCSALQHAHKNLVVHRDLKPDNIRVTEEGEVKLLDFGIAKLLDDGSESADLTSPGLDFMTPSFAAPEQINRETITTSTDIYSLGIILYQLLSGSRPYELKGLSRTEIAKLVCEEKILKPSSKTLRSDLQSKLSGDLDHIVLKATRKEVHERYDSAQSLHDDISAYLNGYPIAARKGNRSYAGKKFIKRNAGLFGLSAAFLLALLSGAWIYTSNIKQERDLAEEGQASARASMEFLSKMIREADPFSQGKSIDSVSVRDLLVSGTRKARTELEDNLRVKADVLSELGTVYNSLDMADSAKALLNDGYQIRQDILDPEDPDIAESLIKLALIESRLGDKEKAAELLKRSLEINEKSLGPLHRMTETSLNNLGIVHIQMGELEKASEYLQRRLDIVEQVYPSESGEMATVASNLAYTYEQIGELDKAAFYHEKSLHNFEVVFGPDHLRKTQEMVNYGGMLYKHGLYEKSDSLITKALDLLENALGDDHQRVLNALEYKARVIEYKGQYEEALEILSRLKSAYLENRPEGHSSHVSTMANTGRVLRKMGRIEEALAIHHEALPKVVGSRLPIWVNTHLARDYHAIGDTENCLRYADAAKENAKEVFGEDEVGLIYNTQIRFRCMVDSQKEVGDLPAILYGFFLDYKEKGLNPLRATESAEVLIHYLDSYQGEINRSIDRSILQGYLDGDRSRPYFLE